MTRKDYVLLAQEIAAEVSRFKTQAYGATQLRGLRAFAERLAARLNAENQRFDVQRFLSDCGLADPY